MPAFAGFACSLALPRSPATHRKRDNQKRISHPPLFIKSQSQRNRKQTQPNKTNLKYRRAFPMEGTGPRLSRVYSRYGLVPAPSAPVFAGPVRKWKRKWVPSEPNKDNAVAGNRGLQHQEQDAPCLLLCRWTPLNSSCESSEPSKRKFRYTPVIVFEEKKKKADERLNDDAARIQKNQSRADVIMTIDMPFEKPHINDNFVEEMKEPGEDHAYFENLDLQL